VSWIEAAARWYLVLAAVTWAFFPVVAWLCRALPERGVTLARPIAMLAAVYPAWLLASIRIVPFSGLVATVIVIAAAALGWSLAIRRRHADRAWLRSLVLVELVSLLLFAAYLWLRGYTPQILGTEKPMDIAFLASSTRAMTIPPPDPWFAGEPINYYYLGYLLHGTVARLSGVAPETGFNLALATIFSTTAVAAFGVAWNVVRPWLGPRLAAAGGLVATFAVAISGNLYAPWRMLQDPTNTVSAWWWDSVAGIGWRSSRIVCDGARVNNRCEFPSTETINEFPFFSFLLGDLHPHLMALPFTVVAVGLAWNLTLHLRARNPGGAAERRWLARIGISGAVVGSLYAINAWDLPTFLLLVAIGVWIGAGASLSRAWKPLLLLALAAMAAWFPFLATYVPPTSGAASGLPTLIARLPVVSSLVAAVGLHRGERTSVIEYLTIFGVPYAFGVALVIAGAAGGWSSFRSCRAGRAIGVIPESGACPGSRVIPSKRTEEPRQNITSGELGMNFVASDRNGALRRTQTIPQTLLIAAVVTMIPGVLLSAPIIPLCGIPLALAISQLRTSTEVNSLWFALLLYSIGWALSIGVELIYIRDVFDDRMNTLFKFYYQTWTLFALAMAVTLPVLWRAASGVTWRRAVLSLATVAAILAGAAYPAVASYQWTDHFAAWQGLDGLAYGEKTDPDDTTAIRWLAQHAAPGDVVLEAAGCSYLPFDRLPFNRVSAFTGIPTVIGWGNNHQRQWRAGQPELVAQINRRETEVAAMFADPDSPLFDSYGVDWLFVGDYEAGDWQTACETAGPYDIARLPGESDAGWEEAFRSRDTRIYRRIRG
jgi:YYY domain-containing protein